MTNVLHKPNVDNCIIVYGYHPNLTRSVYKYMQANLQTIFGRNFKNSIIEEEINFNKNFLKLKFDPQFTYEIQELKQYSGFIFVKDPFKHGRQIRTFVQIENTNDDFEHSSYRKRTSDYSTFTNKEISKLISLPLVEKRRGCCGFLNFLL